MSLAGPIRYLTLLGIACCVLPAGAGAREPARGLKLVRYHGYVVRVPRSWPVFDLARAPDTCVRFNRHAVYLGVPSPHERCPAHSVGRNEAILITPSGVSTAPVAASAAVGARAARSPHLRAQTGSAPYTGRGFDTCSAPSTTQMSAWSRSPYHALGIYIGGVNAACAQPTLNASWVSGEVAAGWHLLPIYVGLQAPSNGCGCSAIVPAKASTEGGAAASTAVAKAQALGLPAGSAIYYDMEAYTLGSSSSAVLTFLAAWTTRLHADGYRSGVYSSAASGITDLVREYGSSYSEPDYIWVADWNGERNAGSEYVPAADWADNQRVHQYEGGHDESYGGTTFDIDSDYVDVAAIVTAPPPPVPSLWIWPGSTGTTYFYPSWPRRAGIASWRVLAGSSSNPGSLTAIGGASGSKSPIAIRSSAPYFAVQALGAAGQVLGGSPVITVRPHLAVFGHGAFVSATGGSGSLPVGCFTGAVCRVVTTVSVGHTTIARTGAEGVGRNSTGIVHFVLTRRGGAMLLSARGGKLAVKLSMRDVSGAKATVASSLTLFSGGGGGQGRSLIASPLLRIPALTDFVSPDGAGGMLVGCRTTAPCQITATVSLGGAVVARSRPELIGGRELGYVSYALSAQGRAMLARAGGTLAAHVALAVSGGIAADSGAAAARVLLVELG